VDTAIQDLFNCYLLKTRNAVRGLKPIITYSLDDFLYSGGQRRIDRIAASPAKWENTEKLS
jgi:hypothetical protein